MSLLGFAARGSALVAALLLAQSASALPETYVLAAGSATVTVHDVNPDGTLTQIGGPLAMSLNGVQVTIDEDPGLLLVTELNLTTLGPWVLAVDPSRTGGFDTITIQHAGLLSTNGSLSLLEDGNPRVYDYTVGPVTVTSSIVASGVFVPVPVPLELVLTTASAGGTMFVEDNDLQSATLTLDGITIAEVISPLSGGRTVVKADFVFEGRNVVPEPHAVVLFALGGGIIAYATRKSLLRQ